MNVSKNIATSLGLVICAVMTGCGGGATSEDITEIRSLLEDLAVIEEPNAEEEVVVVPVVEETVQEEIAEETIQEEVAEETVQEEIAEETVQEEIAEETVQEEVAEETVQEEVAEETVQEEVAEETVPETPTATIAGQLTWEPAGFYEDGTVMTMDEISHYQIVFGTSEDSLSESVEFSVAGLLTYEFAASTSNTWFVGVKTVSIYGGVSDTSNLKQFNI